MKQALFRWLPRARSRRWVALLVGALALLCLSPSALAQPSGPMPTDIGFDPHLGARVPADIHLVDEAGEERRLGDYLDGKKPVVLVLAYYECPMLCSMVLSGLVSALKRSDLTPGTDFDVVVASIDPADTPARAAAKKASYVAYFDRPGAAGALHFLTGRAGEVKRLADAVGFKYAYDPIGKQFAHPAGVLVLTGDGTISQYHYGVDFAPRDLRLGLVKASRGTIGTTTDRLLLLCFHYDPAQGRYGAIALASLRVGGVLMLVSLGALLALLGRRQRPEKAPSGEALSARDGPPTGRD